jgi:predicted O-linked N-acetylglucosamine transferase (SPINDLY family)
VPVVTLAGLPHAARVGVSLLRCVGLPELVAESPDRYVQIASGLARERAALSNLRRAMRERVRTSPLCDAAGFARRFVDAVASIDPSSPRAPTSA